MIHDDPTGAHFSVRAMYEKLKERYYWPKMKEDIETYVKSCDQCQRRRKPKNKNKLNPIKVKEPFYQIGIDIVGPLNETTEGNKYIVVAIDYFTKWPEARAIREATAKEVSTFIYEKIICRHGCLKKIIMDRETHFNNRMIEELMNKFKVRHLLSTPYHPETNGLVERFNGTLCEALAKVTKEKEDWDQYISPVLFAYRTTKQKSTKIEPFYLTYGRKPKLPIDQEERQEITIAERIQTLIEELPRERGKAKERIKESQEKQKKYHDQKIKEEIKFEIGDNVLYFNTEQ